MIDKGAPSFAIWAAKDPDSTNLTEIGEMMHSDAVNYVIRNGQLVTSSAGTELAVTVYRLGGRYIAAKHDEYDFANYDVSALP